MLTRQVSRPADLVRLDELFAMITECDGHSPIGEHKYLDLLHSEPDKVTGMVAEEAGETVAYVAVSPTQEPETWGLELAVHPLHREHDTIRHLVDAGLDHAARHGAERVRVWTFQPKLAAVLEEAGFTPERELRQLRTRLPVVERPLFTSSVEVRPFRIDQDEDAWIAVNNRSFAGHPENGSWTREVFADRKAQAWFDPAGFRMAWEGGELVGFCWTKIHHGALGEIYVIAVSPSAQGRGLGRALVLEGCRYLSEEAGMTRAMLYVDAGNERALSLYERLGFRLDHVDRSFVFGLP